MAGAVSEGAFRGRTAALLRGALLFGGTHFLLADEMSTMLDVITQAQIWNLMLREVEKRKIGLLAVTHNMALADCVCTRTINLAQVNHIKCAEESGCKNGCEYGTV